MTPEPQPELPDDGAVCRHDAGDCDDRTIAALRAAAVADAARDADRYAEALAGARAMRYAAVWWADAADHPDWQQGADADERRYGIPAPGDALD